MDEITSELIDAAQSGEAALLDKIDSIDPRYHKVVLATLALSLSAVTVRPALHRVTSLR